MAEVRAAGGIVIRDGQVLVVHRRKYDDWSLPKGKLDEGETWEECAVRELREETGLECEIGDEAGRTFYVDAEGRDKEVRYYWMTCGGEPVAQNEVDGVRWLEIERAHELLSYQWDVEFVRKLA